MSIQHPVFMRSSGDKVIVITVMDKETLGFAKDEVVEHFGIAVSSKNIYTADKPQITIKTRVTSEQYVKGCNESAGNDHMCKTQGEGINGVLRGPYWAIIPMQTVEDMMS